MFDRIKQRSAIKSYFMQLSLELFSRFGKKYHYTVDEVSRTAESAGFKTEHLAYAFALFFDRKDFSQHYKRTPCRDRYEVLRGEVSVRYFGGVREFDATNIIDAVRHLEIDAHFHESGEGFFGVFTH